MALYLDTRRTRHYEFSCIRGSPVLLLVAKLVDVLLAAAHER